MGQLIYDSGIHIDIDDRTLAHLQIVVYTKLHRGERFPFHWTTPAAQGSGRGSVWIAPELAIRFKFLGSRQAAINEEWIEQLMAAANTPTGLQLIPEPRPADRSRTARTRHS